ncbi:hypothetical protein [Methanocella arvoryzae]|uniref:Uncharacterized protein n=1 Tax=Methanocella arvoryzae (strain DSM 22066 / NBRC 105507 / MRE50) TaxID=351160 RepID=Q0W527_METAR|nr:hypothetical protein [Methanocella arvoryzae]CAJ36516.1 hypothetical protein RCIX1212 [Methanocella arvoryzae MRE50]
MAMDMGIRDFLSTYLKGSLGAGISFALINLLFFFALYKAWVRFRALAFAASDIWQNPGSANAIYGEMLALAFLAMLCMALLFVMVAVAGAVSAWINQISGESAAAANGLATGAVMWIVTGAAGLAAFPEFGLFLVSGTLDPSHYVDPYGNVKYFQILVILLVWVHLLVPVLFTLWAFVKYSTFGSLSSLNAHAQRANPTRDFVIWIRGCVAAFGRPWVKTTVIVMAIAWPIILYYCAIVWILSLH